MDSRSVSGSYFESFWVTEADNFSFFSDLFPAHFLYQFSIETWTLGVAKIRFSYRRYCKTQLFTEIIFYRFWGVFLFFLEALGAAFLISAALAPGLNIDGVSGV